MDGSGNKMSRSGLNMSESGSEWAENEWGWVRNELKWVGVLTNCPRYLDGTSAFYLPYFIRKSSQ